MAVTSTLKANGTTIAKSIWPVHIGSRTTGLDPTGGGKHSARGAAQTCRRDFPRWLFEGAANLRRLSRNYLKLHGEHAPLDRPTAD